MNRDKMGIYVHIPFCAKKCNYCDFLSKVGTENEMDLYVEALLREIRTYNEEKYPVSTIFFGGGTPSIIEETYIRSIMDAIKDTFRVKRDVEITLEANPGTLTREKIAAYKKAGINRISLGLQSVNSKELKQLGRIHTYDEFLESYEILRQEGINNINVDLMSGLPRQSSALWEKSLRTVADLNPEHISVYGLIIEEETPFYKLYAKDEKRREAGKSTEYLPDEEQERDMYYLTKRVLQEYGFSRYEISNYAKKGYECRHNIGYWDRSNYKGFGCGAASMMDNVRSQNESDIQEYMKAKEPKEYEDYLFDYITDGIFSEDTVLSLSEQMEEFMYLGLRMMEGICIDDFEEQFSLSFQKVYGDVVADLVDKGLLIKENQRIRLTDIGIDLSNYVFKEFLT